MVVTISVHDEQPPRHGRRDEGPPGDRFRRHQQRGRAPHHPVVTERQQAFSPAGLDPAGRRHRQDLLHFLLFTVPYPRRGVLPLRSG